MPELTDCCRRSMQLAVAITLPSYAVELFQLTDRNRGFLGQWLPWLDTIGRPEDTLRFIHEQEQRRLRGEALHCTIFYQGQIAGVVAFNSIDPANGTAVLGYWLGREYAGRGIMTRAADAMLAAGFADYGIRLVELTCDPENIKSRRLAMRLGFHEVPREGGSEERAILLYRLGAPSCLPSSADNRTNRWCRPIPGEENVVEEQTGFRPYLVISGDRMDIS